MTRNSRQQGVSCDPVTEIFSAQFYTKHHWIHHATNGEDAGIHDFQLKSKVL